MANIKHPPMGDICMQNSKQKNIHRIKIIKGHLLAIERMLEADKYCVDIVHQSQAVQKALKKLDESLLKGHLEHCVVHQAKTGQIDKVVEDLIGIFKYK